MLVKQRIIDLSTFSSIYKTRVMGLLSNKNIRAELNNNKKWAEFYDLLSRLNLSEKDSDGESSIIVPEEGWKEYIESDAWRK